MSLSVSVVRNLENNRVLIQEKSGTEKHPVERYYVAPQEKADKFIAQKQTLNTNRKFQNIMTYFLSAGIGLLVGTVLKFGTAGKIISGIGVGLLAFLGSKKADKSFNNKLEQINMKNHNVEEVTGQNPESIK